MTRKVGFGAWVATVILLTIVAGVELTEDKVYVGTNIEIQNNTRHLLIVSKRGIVFIKAFSDKFFFLMQGGNGDEIVVGKKQRPPLGWKGLYYQAAKEIPDGIWLLKEGNPTVRIVSEGATVRAVEQRPGFWWALCVAVGMIILLISYLLLIP